MFHRMSWLWRHYFLPLRCALGLCDRRSVRCRFRVHEACSIVWQSGIIDESREAINTSAVFRQLLRLGAVEAFACVGTSPKLSVRAAAFREVIDVARPFRRLGLASVFTTAVGSAQGVSAIGTTACKKMSSEAAALKWKCPHGALISIASAGFFPLTSDSLSSTL